MHVPNPHIVPGGRFREFYYWDSYWIMLGLLTTEMHSTVKGMLGNFLSLVEGHGFIPNGGRLYFSGRSQPPLLIPMVKEYFDVTNDLEFIQSSMLTMEKEFDYWWINKTIQVRGHSVAIYADLFTNGPRPESYAEDVAMASELETPAQKEFLYAELKAACESGMDFTSRWFVPADGSNNGTLFDIRARAIVPVELNAVLYWNAQILSEFAELLNDTVKAAAYRVKADQFYAAVQDLFWNEEIGAWLDWDLVNERQRDFFVPTNLSPLWTGCFNHTNKAHLANRVLAYIEREGLDRYPGGVPNTLERSGEQWDFPNVWPPMQVPH